MRLGFIPILAVHAVKRSLRSVTKLPPLFGKLNQRSFGLRVDSFIGIALAFVGTATKYFQWVTAGHGGSTRRARDMKRLGAVGMHLDLWS